MQRIRLIALPLLGASLLLLGFFRSASQAALPDGQAIPHNSPLSIPYRRLHPALVKILATTDPAEMVPVIIEWRSAPLSAILPKSAQGPTNRLEQRSLVVSALQNYSQSASAALLSTLQTALLQGQAADIQAFWVSPVIAAKATPGLIEALSGRDDVQQIRPDERLWLEKVDFSAAPSQTGMPWNLNMMDVSLAQGLLGLDGSGVVVASLDTGVDWQHPALLKKYRGYNPQGPAQHTGNWFVVTGEDYRYPGDGIGHGTHTMGTMVGDDGTGDRTGVAPGAKWISVKLFNNQGYTYESWIHAAFQWVLAPAGNPALAPDIVNNSWGSTDGSDDRYRPDLAALLAAGILPVFSAGNNGPLSYTVDSPGSYPEALAVGAVDQDRIPALFSSRGPSPWNEIKPEVSAPGVAIWSTYPGGGYALANGTSMAAPHVSGLAALLRQANPSLTPAELERIIISSAEPLGAITPNNTSGWGAVNAYSAALKVAPHGEVLGIVTRNDNAGTIHYPVLSAVPFSLPGDRLTFTGDVDGRFRVALKPDSYDIRASAFGYLTQTVHAISVRSGEQVSLTIPLTELPSGWVSGKVTDSQAGTPLSATLSVEGTPLQTHSDPLSGLYFLRLPAGSWPIRIQAPVHHTTHITPTVTTGATQVIDITLTPAPRLLLVDGGRWYYQSQIQYYQDALDTLGQPYDLWPIRSLGYGDNSDERPKASDLKPYDIVIWADPQSSPGWIGMDNILTDYLKSGGRLLLSGEDILFLDGGGIFLGPPAHYMIEDMGIEFDHEGDLNPLQGVAGTVFEGLKVFLNTPDSIQNLHPDAAGIRDDFLAHPALVWPGPSPGGVTAGTCRPYRAYWQGMDFEGVGPRSRRIELLRRILAWFELPPDLHNLAVKPTHTLLIGKPGETVTQTIEIHNTGVLSDNIALHFSSDSWPVDLELPGRRRIQQDTVIPMKACDAMVLTATVTIPLSALRDERSTSALSFTSQALPGLQSSLTLTTKTHAPLLLVDHQVFFHNLEPYTRTLTTLGIPYDIYNTDQLHRTRIPSTDTLFSYPTVLWTTGYNWYDPLGPGGRPRLEAYLDQGGRLLLSSQDLLDVYGKTAFTRERLGIQAATLSVTATQVTGENGPPFWADMGPWELSYHFPNWSDSFTVAPTSTIILRDPHRGGVGLIHPAQDWRTAFFSFPLETLDPAANLDIGRRLLLWLSDFGESRLDAPLAANAGTQIPISLTLGLARSQPLTGVRVIFPLPVSAGLVPDSLTGDWVYQPESHALVWEGGLQPGISQLLGARLQLPGSLPDGAVVPLQAFFYDSQGLVTVAYTPVHIHVPWLHLQTETTPGQLYPGETAHFILTLSNLGVITSTARLTITLPQGLQILTPSLQASAGVPAINSINLTWSSGIAPGSSVNLAFDGMANSIHGGYNWLAPVQASDGYARRADWFSLLVLARLYFPYIYNSYYP